MHRRRAGTAPCDFIATPRLDKIDIAVLHQQFAYTDIKIYTDRTTSTRTYDIKLYDYIKL
jgi:hypothetical protein